MGAMLETVSASVWWCDMLECDRVEASSADGYDGLRYHMPAGWSAVLVTSSDDGDHDLVLCPSHTSSLKRSEIAPGNRDLTGRG